MPVGVVRDSERRLQSVSRSYDKRNAELKDLGRSARAGDSPVGIERSTPCVVSASTAGHEKPCGKQGRPRSKATYTRRPIANEYREGKVKSTPARGVKESLKPSVYSRRECYASCG
jgi:hypothetical protein